MRDDRDGEQQALSRENAKRYNTLKIRIAVIDLAVSAAFIGVLAFSGVSRWLVVLLQPFAGNEYLLFIYFICAIAFTAALAGLPLDFYMSYLVEHRFGLSRQSIPAWLFERTKSAVLSVTLGIPVALAFYYFIQISGEWWWLYFGALVFLIAVILARLAPVLIYPLFYTFTPLKDEALRERLSRLLETHGIGFRGIYTFNMSKDTRKANAGFTGIGRSRRIILSDTLLERFTHDEITVVFAHEMGHYLRRHIAKNILLSGIIIFAAFFLCGSLHSWSIESLGYASPHEIAALPILFFYLSLFGLVLTPLTNALSRHYEREADRFAIECTGDARSFIASMEKLASMNLSDREPHPLVEFFFYSHPPIKKRIEAARQPGERAQKREGVK